MFLQLVLSKGPVGANRSTKGNTTAAKMGSPTKYRAQEGNAITSALEHDTTSSRQKTHPPCRIWATSLAQPLCLLRRRRRLSNIVARSLMLVYECLGTYDCGTASRPRNCRCCLRSHHQHLPSMHTSCPLPMNTSEHSDSMLRLCSQSMNRVRKYGINGPLAETNAERRNNGCNVCACMLVW